MLKRLLPDEYVASIFDINVEGLKKKGIKALIVDIDNTLEGWGTKSAGERVLNWISKLKSLGFTICLISNNTKRRAVEFAKPLDVPVVYRAAKPSKRAFKKAMKITRNTYSECAVIGDQIFTDVLGGKRLGFYTILVAPINKKEFITTKLIRRVEKMTINRMAKKGWLIKPDIEKQG